MKKKMWLGFVVSFVVFEVLGYLVYSVILKSSWEATASLWRADMMSYAYLYVILTIIGSFFFSFIFSKGYEGKGIGEGIRYGLYIGIWLSSGMAYGTYGMVAIPYSLALQWFLCGVVEYVIAGIVLAWIFGRKEKEPAKA